MEKDPAHIKFENLMDDNQEKIKILITYNSDENVKAFNHSNYELKTILNSKKIFRQESSYFRERQSINLKIEVVFNG